MNRENNETTYSADKCIPASNALIAAALSYAEKGWPVVPLHSQDYGQCSCGNLQCAAVAKHPVSNHGVTDATLKVSTIKDWWQRWPDANIGLVTGADSGLVVLDVDPRHEGDYALAKLEEAYGGLPKTVESLTGGGGRHILFQHPGGYIKSRSIGDGLDIKADGGYIVAPPSLHQSGKEYAWEVSSHPEDTMIAQMPSWLHGLVMTGPPKRNSANAQTTDRIPEGSRNNTLASLGGSMRHRGMTESSIEAALLAENKLRCDPPLAKDEVRKIAASVSQYPPGNSTSPTSTADSGSLSTSTIGLILYQISKPFGRLLRCTFHTYGRPLI